jgi:hypothetical protein
MSADRRAKRDNGDDDEMQMKFLIQADLKIGSGNAYYRNQFPYGSNNFAPQPNVGF